MQGNTVAERVRQHLPLLALRLIRAFRGVSQYVTSDYKKHLYDKDFMTVWQTAKENTLVDVLRLHELWSLVGQTAKLDPGAYVEVGVWRGGSGLVIAEARKRFDVTGTVYLADTFTGVVKADPAVDAKYRGGEHADTSQEYVANLLKGIGVSDFELLRGIFPEDTADRVSGQIRLLHVDVDVYQGAKDVVEWAFPRLVTCGIVVFDDYGFRSTVGVTKLCEEYERDPRFIFIHNWNGHAVLIKRP